MYNEIIKKLVHLSHSELQTLASFVQNEIEHRESLNPIAWSCPLCDYGNVYFLSVIYHLQNEHDMGQIRAIHAAQGVFA